MVEITQDHGSTPQQDMSIAIELANQQQSNAITQSQLIEVMRKTFAEQLKAHDEEIELRIESRIEKRIEGLSERLTQRDAQLMTVMRQLQSNSDERHAENWFSRLLKPFKKSK